MLGGDLQQIITTFGLFDYRKIRKEFGVVLIVNITEVVNTLLSSRLWRKQKNRGGNMNEMQY